MIMILNTAFYIILFFVICISLCVAIIFLGWLIRLFSDDEDLDWEAEDKPVKKVKHVKKTK